MKIGYSRRALADIQEIAAYCSVNAGPAVALSIQSRFIEVVERIRRSPESAPRVTQRPHVRVASVVRYAFRIFYRIRGDGIDVVHIRHTSRRSARFE